jgi:curved DNA-binding protein CbpA
MPPPAAFDYYEALEIERTATNEEIKSSYRRLARIHHPDKNLDNPEATAAFQKVNRTLSKTTSPTGSKNLVLILLINVDSDCPRNTI